MILWSARYSHAVRDALDFEVPFEMIFDLAAGPSLPSLAQVIHDRSETAWKRVRNIVFDRVQRRLHGLPCLLRIEEVGIYDFEERRI